MTSEAAGTQAIDRAARLLVRVVESARPLGVGELAAQVELPKSTTSRLLTALERQGLVQRHDGRLRPGPVLLRFAGRDGTASLVELARPVLRRLAEATGETVNLATPGPLGVEHLAQEDGAHFVGVGNWVGRRVPDHAAANGKLFLAYGAAPQPAELERLTDRTITHPARLDEELARVRARGYATTVDELELGLTALAAPVFRGDAAIAALSVSGPSARLTRERVAGLAPLLIEEAHGLALRLGHCEPERGAA